MKKISKKIAMILFLLVIVCSFTNCLSWFLMTGEFPDYSGVSGEGAIGLIFLPIVDIIVLPVALVVLCVRLGIESARDRRGDKYDDIDTFSAAVSSLPETEVDSLMLTFDSLPEAELASLIQRFDSLPSAEFDSFSETLNSFSDSELAAIVSAFNNLSESEIESSIETLNSMPDENFIAALDDVRHIEFRYQ